jgi:autotransporter passenger strand-loop-strand repeat protein
MSDYILISGQTVSGLTVSAGTYLEIGSGGVAISTLVKDGGYETVFPGASPHPPPYGRAATSSSPPAAR